MVAPRSGAIQLSRLDTNSGKLGCSGQSELSISNAIRISLGGRPGIIGLTVAVQFAFTLYVPDTGTSSAAPEMVPFPLMF